MFSILTPESWWVAWIFCPMFTPNAFHCNIFTRLLIVWFFGSILTGLSLCLKCQRFIFSFSSRQIKFRCLRLTAPTKCQTTTTVIFFKRPPKGKVYQIGRITVFHIKFSSTTDYWPKILGQIKGVPHIWKPTLSWGLKPYVHKCHGDFMEKKNYPPPKQFPKFCPFPFEGLSMTLFSTPHLEFSGTFPVFLPNYFIPPKKDWRIFPWQDWSPPFGHMLVCLRLKTTKIFKKGVFCG